MRENGEIFFSEGSRFRNQGRVKIVGESWRDYGENSEGVFRILSPPWFDTWLTESLMTGGTWRIRGVLKRCNISIEYIPACSGLRRCRHRRHTRRLCRLCPHLLVPNSERTRNCPETSTNVCNNCINIDSSTRAYKSNVKNSVTTTSCHVGHNSFIYIFQETFILKLN